MLRAGALPALRVAEPSLAEGPAIAGVSGSPTGAHCLDQSGHLHQISELVDCHSPPLRVEYQLMDETNPAKARSRAYWLVLPVLAAAASLWFFFLRDCFFSVPVYDSLFWVIPCLLCLSGTPWFVLVLRKLRDKNGTSSTGDSLASALFVGLIGGFALLPFVGMGALGAVYVSSTETVQFSSSIGIRKGPGGRGCHWYLRFYNRPIQRDVTLCAEDRGISGAKSGDVLTFEEKVGPLGARLINIRKLN